MPTSLNVSTSSSINATASIPVTNNTTNNIIPKDESMYRTAALLLLCIGTLVLLAIICYKMYKNKKKRERNQDQNGISTYDPSSEGTQQFFAIDRYNYLPISIRCQEYIDIRAGRMPRVIEQSEVDQEQPPTRKSIITVDRCVNTALSFFRGIPN